MNLKELLYNYCEKNDLKELLCIIHISLLNHVSSLNPKGTDWVNLSPKVLDYYTGIGEEIGIDLFNYLSSKTELVNKEYRFNCKKDVFDFSYTFSSSEIKDKNHIVVECCESCDDYHLYNLEDIDYYEVGFSVYKSEFINQLKMKNDAIKELVVLNTNEQNIEGLAKIIVSKMKIEGIEKKEKVKKGLVGYLHSIRDVTSVISDISGDAESITSNIMKMVEHGSGISILKNVFSSDSKIEE